MATIVRELWGPHPNFLKIVSKKSLFELLAPRQADAVGTRVVPTHWHNRGLYDHYYTITDVKLKSDLRHGQAWGVRTWKNVPGKKSDPIRSALKYNWHIYMPPKEQRKLEQKLRIPADAPTS
ncbi:hypothetical protein HK102_000395 [Quaeritorhiza haematococci]|nr:hypothetical protein HK102_000395 [Quaeritorhiza haematococci]